LAYPSKKDLLKKHPLFESLGWWQLRTVSKQAYIVEVEKGEVIIHEDDPGEAFYLVVSGRCEAFTRLKSGRNRVFEHYHNGDSFGEMPLLSGETHWCSVRALNDSLLLKIDKNDFDDIVDKNPDISRELSARLARRIKDLRSEKEEAKWSQIIGIGSAVEEIGKTLFGMNVSAALNEETGEPICLIDFSRQPAGFDLHDLEPTTGEGGEWVHEVTESHEGGFDYVSANLPEEETRDFLRPFFGGFVKQYNYVFVILPEGMMRGTMNVYRQCDQVYLLTDTDERVIYQTRLLINELEEKRGHDKEELKVILARLPEGEITKQRGVESQLNYGISYRLPEITPSPGPNHHERTPLVKSSPEVKYSRNIRRIARQIGNVSVGLALGSGAARGFAHIGVIRVLEEAGIVVDVVAGSSMGALIAAVWASGADADEMEAFAREFREWGGLWSWGDLSFPPSKSILRGGHVRRFLDRMLGDSTFSDTEFPLNVVATDLDELEEVSLNSGRLADAVRASISIPMVFEPVRRDNRTLVDGGVLEPIPVQSLMNYGVSRIIAVNPIPPIDVLQEYQRTTQKMRFDEPSSWLSAVKKQLLPFGEGNIIDTFMRSLQAMQAQLATTATSEANIVLEPVVPSANWFDFQEPEKFIEKGEFTAREHLEEIKEIARPERPDIEDAASGPG
jgi:predicted acylesterase/phospholipase RssA/CRP-like cAMP-binding protein/cellulose biosynthesis protein BcsQ